MILAAFVAAVALMAAILLFWDAFRDGEQAPENPTPPPVVATIPSTATPAPAEESVSPAIEPDGLPHDKLFITPERQRYASGTLRLLLPKLAVDVPVLDGVTSEVLSRGVGLYDYAQLPGEGNRNVSLAGHRNGLRGGKITDDMPFYYLDTLAEGDYLYLADETQVYRYTYESTETVEEDDWGPIYSQGYSCLTLTSCTPIGVSDHRIIVRGRLDCILPWSADFEYLEAVP